MNQKLIDLSNQLLDLINAAPDGIREYLQKTFWILIFLIILWVILKLLFSKEFKNLYKALGNGAQKAGEIGKSIAQGAAKELELPEPYPRVTKFFAVIFMINGYFVAFFFACLFLVTSGMLVLSPSPDFWARNLGLLFSLVCGFFAWSAFAQAERDRIALFRKNDANS
ncbi:hypothetical protein [Aeromonas caviae]|uniref:hypothetical protein n=1 Tax=Aeromonas caviae TaxID=648 RepID=UPI002DD679C0|nr:hypothetical protein [Aeromonas caviae]